MQKISKFPLLVATMAVVFAFASCKVSSDDDTPAVVPATTPAVKPANTPADTPAPDAGSKVEKFCVTFNSNDGSEVPSQTIENGKKASRPAAPTKADTATEAFLFDNWYTSTDDGKTLSDNPFDFDTAITKNITLYANWQECIVLKDCSAINALFNTLCDRTATSFAKASAKPDSAIHYLDAEEKRIPLWYEAASKTLYYYLEPGKKMSLRTSNGKNELFAHMLHLKSINTCDFDTSKVTDMSFMFYRCGSLKTLDVSKFNTSNVTNMKTMFRDCNNLTTLNISNFDTSNVTDMCMMFFECGSLEALDVSKFDTSKVTDMGGMFNACIILKTIYASEKFVTNKVTNSIIMFADCKKLEGGAGTAYDAKHTDKTYARIDVSKKNPGYFTKKPQGSN